MIKKIIFDPHEKDSGIPEILKKFCGKSIEILPKADDINLSKEKFDPTADYILIVNDKKFGIERKRVLECWSAIIDGRIYKQIKKLKAKYGGNAIFLLERDTYFPSKLKWRRREIEQATHTFFSERGMEMKVLYSISKEHSAYLIAKILRRLNDEKES